MNYLKKYINKKTIDEIKTKYNAQIVDMLKTEKTNIEKVINLFIKNGFEEIDNILLNHVNIFVLSPYYVEDKLKDLKRILGEDWVTKIQSNHNLLEIII